MLMEQVHAGWTRNKVSSLLLLDASGTFDNVNHIRVLWKFGELGFNKNLVTPKL